MKKIVSVLMCLCLVLSTFTFVGFSASADTNSGSAGDGITWSLDGDVMTISGDGYVYAGDWSEEQRLATKSIVFSDGIQGVTTDSFTDFTSLTSVTFADSVETVDIDAFSGATALKTITIGKNFGSRIGGTFNDYPSLETVNISEENNWYTVVDGVVYDLDMSSVEFYPPAKTDESFKIPDGVFFIYSSAFQNNTYLESVEIPDSVDSIYDNAFLNCTALSSFIGGKNIVYVGSGVVDNTAYYNDASNWENGVLYFCNTLYKADNNKISKDVVVKNGTVVINDQAFENCTNLETLVLPDSLEKILFCAFSNCTSLKSVDLGKGVKEFGQWVFENTALESVELPASVEEFDAQVFTDCQSLTSVTVSENNKYFSSADGVVFNKDKSILVCYPCGKTDESYTVPSTVVKIDDEAFYGNEAIEEVVIGDSVEIIDYNAFYDCSALKTITLGKNINTIGSYAFNRTAYYEEADNWQDGGLYIGNYFIDADNKYEGKFIIKEGTELIAYSAFEYCGGITDISIPDSVKYINIYDLSDTALYYDESKWENGALYIDNHLIKVKPEITGEFIIKPGTKTIADKAFYECGITKVTIPDSVVTIGRSAFDSCTQLESVIIPDGVKYLGEYAFGYCYDLKSVTLPKNLEIIRDGAFIYCQLESVIIPEGVKYIGEWAFSCCDIKSVTLPKTLESIGNKAFSSCYWLESVILPEGVKYLGEEAFYGCRNLKSVTLPKTLESIGNGTFSFCISLESVTIPDSVVIIGRSAFSHCDNLKSVTLPKTLESIGNGAFGFCKSLESVILPDNVKEIGNDAFDSKTKILANPGTPAYEMLKSAGVDFECNHKYTEKVVKKATCTVTGLKSFACACGDSYTKAISPLSHSAKWVVTKKATHFVNGKKVYKCTACGKTLKTVKTAKLKFTKASSGLTAAKKSIKIKYKKVNYATGIRVRYKTGSGKWKYITFKTQKGATKVIKNLKSGKKYKVQVQAMRKVKGKKAVYSNWTATRTIKVK